MADRPNDNFREFETKILKFDSLMQFRVKNILLVSSLYDSFILEEDGQLTDMIYNEFMELNLTVTPMVKRASNARQALEILQEETIDLVVIFKRVSDIDVVEFARTAKNIKPDLPVVLLAYNERDMSLTTGHQFRPSIDQIFTWSGDVSILLAIIKLVEDQVNIGKDTRLVGVRVIILVEDSVKFYSAYLPLLYTEIMSQTRALMSDGLNLTDRLLRMRARPKIVLANDYEEGWRLFEKYRKYVLAVISDFRFEKDGIIDGEAGIKLVERMREQTPDLPVLMQSSDKSNAAIANSADAGFLHKRSATLNMDMHSFIKSHFGFGDFVFTLADGRRIASASDFRQMEKCLAWVDGQSLMNHAGRNHFSNWCMARSEFDLAARIRPRKVSEFKDVEELRQYLIASFKEFRHKRQLGVVSDFSRDRFDLQSDFVRIGSGSIGGKGRGLAFINALLNKYRLKDSFDGVQITVPFSAVIGTSVFDEFLDMNNLRHFALEDQPDNEIVARFKAAKLPTGIMSDLRALLEVVDFPIAVRSSSMLEDSHVQPFAGVYDTHMLANNHSYLKARVRQLTTAIKLIYASTYFTNTRVFHELSGNRLEDEKMAIIIQQAVGGSRSGRFYPHFSGVAASYNYYSVDQGKPEEGVAYVAVGMGKTIVEGMNCVRFSPAQPSRLANFGNVNQTLDNAQHDFYAIDLTDPLIEPKPGGDSGLIKLPISDADDDKTLDLLRSTYSHENHRIYDSTARQGSPVITFAPILKYDRFPLADIVSYLLKLGSRGLNCPVEIEFAVDLDQREDKPPGFYFLQIRPMTKEDRPETVAIDTLDNLRVICTSNQTLGNMNLTDVSDIVYVPPATFDRAKTVEIAEQVGALNARLKKDGRRYLLIGPGRWGTHERWLGIPTGWDKISGAALIAEVALDDFAVDPSFGTHFFHNLTSFRIGYFTINQPAGNGTIDWSWFDRQKVIHETGLVKHIRTKKPLEILIDGRVGKGAILWT